MARPGKLRPTIRAYLDHLQTKGFMSSTLATYRTQLHHVVDWAEAANTPSLGDLDRDVAENYLLHLRQPELRIPGRWSTLRGFGRWLLLTERIVTNPFEDIVLRSDGHRLPPPVLTADEVAGILEGIPTDNVSEGGQIDHARGGQIDPMIMVNRKALGAVIGWTPRGRPN